MTIQTWTTVYPNFLDTVANQPDLVNDVDDPGISHIHSLRDAIIELETLVGTNNLESGSLRKKIDDLYFGPGGNSGEVQVKSGTDFVGSKWIYDDSAIEADLISNGNAEYRVSSYYSNSSWPLLSFSRGRGTQALKSSILSSDIIGEFIMSGYNGSSYSDSVKINVEALEDWDLNNRGSAFNFIVTESGTNLTTHNLSMSGGVLISNKTRSEIIYDGEDRHELNRDGHSGELRIISFSSLSNTTAGSISFRKARGSFSSRSPILLNDYLGSFVMSGIRGAGDISTIYEACSIHGQATANWSNSSTPTKIRFQTVQENHVGTGTKMTVDPDGSWRFIEGYSGYTIGGTNKDVYVDSDGYVGVLSSSLRFKTNIVDMENIDWFYELRPVNFEYINSPGQKQYGLIAEEVELINNSLVTYADVHADGYVSGGEDSPLSGAPAEYIPGPSTNLVDGVTYTKLIPVLLKSIQNLKERVRVLKS